MPPMPGIPPGIPASEEWVPPATPPKPEAPLSEAEKYFKKIIDK